MTRLLLSPVFVLPLLAVATLLETGCGNGQGYQSPEAVFDAARNSLEQKNYDQFCQCLTPDSQEVMAGGMAMMGMMMKAFAGISTLGGEDSPLAAGSPFSPIDDVLARHGLDEKTLIQMQGSAGDEPVEPLAAMQRMVAPIKDKSAFIGDMFGALEAVGKSQGTKPSNAFSGSLADLQVDGDHATGTMVITIDENENRKPIAFKKLNGGWLIELPLQAEPSP